MPTVGPNIRDYKLKTAREDAIGLAKRDRIPYVIVQLYGDKFEARQMMGCMNGYWRERGFVRERYDKSGQLVTSDLNWGVYDGNDPDAKATHKEFCRAREEARRVQEIRCPDAETGKAPAVSRPAEAQTETA